MHILKFRQATRADKLGFPTFLEEKNNQKKDTPIQLVGLGKFAKVVGSLLRISIISSVTSAYASSHYFQQKTGETPVVNDQKVW